ncbi:PREDICTED: protein STAY-GREEN LIKE, chloroplastic [Tarenaya hassleriana]|uniref:protein STAY-GREEN LIKE, chloroplastic n=1 Tax=Tarenaya hassleriana TaxID=28532 RepID=UPI00053C8A01|nr:PREDICTED: protein STAY-GREEN LIKE, chloroplastic [Tarenaya hassleriana]
MACYIVPYYCNAVLLHPHRRALRHSHCFNTKQLFKRRILIPRNSAISDGGVSYNTLVSEVVRLLVPPANFEASKLKVVFSGEELEKTTRVILPRTYILSHCDFTANLTLTVAKVINLDQLEGWYKKDDVVAEWKKVNDELRLHVHCCVSGPSFLQDVAAELRYHIFSKELPLVLKAVLHGDSGLFRDNPELMDAYVLVYFHSTSPEYNRIECWGPLKDAAKGNQKGMLQGFLTSNPRKKWTRPKSIFHALFTFLL